MLPLPSGLARVSGLRRSPRARTATGALATALAAGLVAAAVPALPPVTEASTAADEARLVAVPAESVVQALPDPPAPEPATLDPGDSLLQSRSPTLQATPARPVAPLDERRSADVVVLGQTTLPPELLAELARLTPDSPPAVLRVGSIALGGSALRAFGVDPSSFRPYAPEGTAESDDLWSVVARGELVVSHGRQEERALALGTSYPVSGGTPGSPATSLRLGGIATTTLPGSDVLLDDGVAALLGLPEASGVVLSASGGDAEALAERVRALVTAAVGDAAQVELLSLPDVGDPVAFLTGSDAGRLLGSFSYRYFPDGTIQPDPEWVRANIRTETVPILGQVTCHRVMLRQLRAALQEVVDAGLASAIHPGEYGGCYVPRFIGRSPGRGVSLHTWGIAVDLNVPGNLRGVAGEIDRNVVAIFKRWGFNWGGDWNWTDPMHFELGSVVSE